MILDTLEFTEVMTVDPHGRCQMVQLEDPTPLLTLIYLLGQTHGCTIKDFTIVRLWPRPQIQMSF
jgi:hypothetical protein